MVRDFQAVIGAEAREQMLEREGRLPDAVVACIGGGSNAIGLFHPFLRRRGRAPDRRRGGRPRVSTDKHAASSDRRPAGRAARQPHLSAAGRRRPDHRRPLDLGRARLSRHRARALVPARRSAAPNMSRPPTQEALAAFQLCSTLEGIIPALEPAHALAASAKSPRTLGKGKIVVLNLCGRGDKDVFTVADAPGRDLEILMGEGWGCSTPAVASTALKARGRPRPPFRGAMRRPEGPEPRRLR